MNKRKLLIYLTLGLVTFAVSVLLLHIISVIAAVGVVNVTVAMSWKRMNPLSWKG